MSGGGKGGGSTQQQEIPDWVKEPSIRNLARSERAQQIGYQAYGGPDLAAITPTQRAAMQNNIDAAAAFGLNTPAGGAMAGMPTEQAYGDGSIRGYSAMPLYEQAKGELARRDPNQQEIYNSLFGDRSVG